MSNNRGKPIEDCITEREAELAWLKHLTDPADMKRSRQRITALGNRIQRLNTNKPDDEEVAAAAMVAPSADPARLAEVVLAAWGGWPDEMDGAHPAVTIAVAVSAAGYRKVEVTEEMVERAAKRIWEVRFVVNDDEWWESIADKGPYKREARAALAAAMGGGEHE